MFLVTWKCLAIHLCYRVYRSSGANPYRVGVCSMTVAASGVSSLTSRSVISGCKGRAAIMITWEQPEIYDADLVDETHQNLHKIP